MAGKRRRQLDLVPAKRRRSSMVDSPGTEADWDTQNLIPTGERSNLIPTGERSDASAVEQLANVMRDVLSCVGSNQGNSRPSMSSSGCRGDAVPFFDPEDSGQNIIQWCNQIDELREIFNWSEETTIYNALAKLQGLAKTWYRSLRTVKYSWEEWKDKLTTAFPSAKDYAERLEEMMKRRKGPGETYIRYYYEKLALINACDNITGREAVSCIIHGIQDDTVRTAARAGDYSQPETLFAYLRTVKSTAMRTKETKWENRKAFPEKARNQRESGFGGKTCFKCGKAGHRAFQCTFSNVKACAYCHKKGHDESRCFAKRDGKPSTSKESTL